MQGGSSYSERSGNVLTFGAGLDQKPEGVNRSLNAITSDAKPYVRV